MSICYNSLFLRGSVKTTYLSEPEIIKTSRLRGHPGVHYFQVLEMVIRFFFNVWILLPLSHLFYFSPIAVFYPSLTVVVCFDAKINFDDNAEFRQKNVFAMDDMTEADPTEMAAAKWDLKYIGLDGNIACFGKEANLSIRPDTPACTYTTQ